ncbi:hypothetical protein FD724_07785 [Nostoc sp. C057]|nr:hypothetical protein FD724_07785 [Nostoc sp. C057]
MSLQVSNASFHQRQDIARLVTQELNNFLLKFFPAYNPAYNIIKLVWYFCKE